jgi:hypothetical protein
MTGIRGSPTTNRPNTNGTRGLARCRSESHHSRLPRTEGVVMSITWDRIPTPEDDGHLSPDRDVNDRVAYNRFGVVVTDRYLQVQGRQYPIRELLHIRTVRGPHSDLTINAGLVAVALMIGIARLWDRLDAEGWVGAIAVLAVPVALTLIGAGLRRRPFEMWAQYHGLTVQLLWELDRDRYYQILRTILRVQRNATP